MRVLATLVLLAPSLAAADNDRSAAMQLMGGISGVAPPDAPVEKVPFTPMVGLSLAWDRLAPTVVDGTERTVQGMLVPDATLLLHGRRPITLAGLRLEALVTTPAHTTAALYVAPRIGWTTDAATPVVGAELGIVFRVHKTWRAGFVYGLYGWQDTSLVAQPISGTIARSVQATDPQSTFVLGAHLAFVVGSELE